MRKTTWTQLDPAMRAELEALLADPNDAFVSDFGDAFGWWLLVLLSCLFGAGVALWSLLDEPIALRTYVEIALNDPSLLAKFPSLPGLVLALLVAAWTVATVLRNRGRRGFAALEEALVVVRGPKLEVFRYDAIRSMARQVIGERGKRFTAVRLELDDGSKASLNVRGTWADAAEAKFEARRRTVA